MAEINVTFKSKSSLVNPAFRAIFDNRDRYILLWGGRDSGKSYSTAVKLVVECLTEKNFKCLLIRKVYDTIKESQYDLIKGVIEDYGLESLFNFKVSPLEIICINGNRFIARGLDKPEKIKSVKDPTKVWYEEANQMTLDDFITVTTSVRSSTAEYLQEILSFNPESDEPDYKDFWLYKRFYEGNEDRMYGTFRDGVTLTIDEEEVTLSYTSIHTTYRDNEYCTSDRKAILEALQETDPYYYEVFTKGWWGNREIGNRFWKAFDQKRHVGNLFIDPDTPLHISLDENVHPYISMTIWQIEQKEVQQIHEIFLRHPKNTVKDLVHEFMLWVDENRLSRSVYLYGDRTSKKEDTKLEKGQNFFTIVESQLRSNYYKVVTRIPTANPPVSSSGDFVNAVYGSNFNNLNIRIDADCKTSINDYINTVEDADGTVKKIKLKDKITGVSYEPHGHASDTKRYFICEAFKDSFNLYLRGGNVSKVKRKIGKSAKRAY